MIVALVDRKIETKSTIDLNVNVSWTALSSVIRSDRQGVSSLVHWPFTLRCSRPDQRSCLVSLASGRTFSTFRFIRSERRFPVPGTPTHLGVQNDPTALIDPKVFLHHAAVFSRKQAVGETYQTVRGGRHDCQQARCHVERPISLLALADSPSRPSLTEISKSSHGFGGPCST